MQLCPSRLCVPHGSVCLGRALPSEAAAAVGADPCRGLDLVLPAGADHEPGVGLAPVPRYLAVQGGHLRKGPECPAQGQLRLGVRQGRVAGSPKRGSREGDRLGGLPKAREQPGPGSPGLDLSQRTHWIYKLSWTSLTFLPILPFTTVIAISAVLLIKGQATHPVAFGAERALGTQGHSSDPNCREAEARSSPGGQLSCERRGGRFRLGGGGGGGPRGPGEWGGAGREPSPDRAGFARDRRRTRAGAGGASLGLRLRGPWDCVIGNYSAWEKRVSRNLENEQEETLATPLRESGVYEL
ncbi:unnamed protein product [Rangifer tarandus platyrhynchus]|uniref:Uncharacterized protein n=2 Tax=Rangifer tarandus platyrhynchus TaxID=3082113 RepID=A0ACB0DWS5_RANTA|nr:unnamed protein product [Rangifer tarandus platyrhynchus]CAI9692619.1 unnamed protein product [Rangifer tarandus platyrhynchus]